MNNKIVNFILGISLLLSLWQCVVFFGNFNEALFPGPITVVVALITLIKDGTLFVHIKDSLFRFAIGYILAVCTAVICGLFLGRSTRLWQIIDPVIQLVR